MNALANAICRERFALFAKKVFEYLHPSQQLELEWYIQAMAHVMEEVVAGRVRRQVISVPPRHLKSIMACVALPAWALGNDHRIKFMIVAYSNDLSDDHSELFRAVIESDWYKAMFPNLKARARGNVKGLFYTRQGGCRRAVSIEGTITGRGADVIVLDDCAKAEDVESPLAREKLKNRYRNTIASRLNSPEFGRILSIQQRLHEDDLSAHLLDLEFTQLKLASIAEEDSSIPLGRGVCHDRKIGDLLSPTRFPLSVLERYRRADAPVFAAQYQQDPVAPGGNLINLDWFGIYEGTPTRADFTTVIQSWDTAMSAQISSDYCVCQTWGFSENHWYLVDVLRERFDYPDLKRAVVRKQKEWMADKVIVENSAAGMPLEQDFRVNGAFKLLLWPATQDKEQRFVATFGEVESGHILLPAEAPWLNLFKAELRAFPKGRYDDQVDAFSQFIAFQKARWGYCQEIPDEHGRRIRPRLMKRPY